MSTLNTLSTNLTNINRNKNWYFRRKSSFEETIKAEYYVNETKFKEVMQNYFMKNQKTSIKILKFKFTIKIIACVLYVLQIYYDKSLDYLSVMPASKNIFDLNWSKIIWVDRELSIWILQVMTAVVCQLEATFFSYLKYKTNLVRVIFNKQFFIELVVNLPFIVTAILPKYHNIFIPSFLNCWLARNILEDIFSELNRVKKIHSTLSYRFKILIATLLCLLFTSLCGFQHFQRAGGINVSLLESLYFVMVTFSTVGYGDYKPDNVLSQLFVVLMICVSVIVLPFQFEQLLNTYKESLKIGQNFNIKFSKNEKHVVVCSTMLDADMILEFLNEFYAHPLLQNFFIVLLSPSDLETTIKLILQSPIWTNRVIYIKCSIFKDSDMCRAKFEKYIQEAEACFLLAFRNCNYDYADEINILRSWAIRDLAPDVPQYVYLFRAKNKIHVSFAEQIVCEDEFKYFILANNCINPGTSTLITLLVHTSNGGEGQNSKEFWHRLYGKSSAYGIHHINLKDSRFFGKYEGKSFTYTSYNANTKYGVTLIGVQTLIKGIVRIILNPGSDYIMKKSDLCFYISTFEEQNVRFQNKKSFKKKISHTNKSFESNNLNRIIVSKREPYFINYLFKNNLFDSLQNNFEYELDDIDKNSDCSDNKTKVDHHLIRSEPKIHKPVNLFKNFNEPDTMYLQSENKGVIKDYQTEIPYVGVNLIKCYKMKEKRNYCCLQLTKQCKHCKFNQAEQYNWSNKSIILGASTASNGIYNFILRLRAYFYKSYQIKPIILLFEKYPPKEFLDVISWFPLVYWLQGSTDKIDDLLLAGIHKADTVVVVNSESIYSLYSINLADCNTIMAIQNMFKMFPKVRIICELSQKSNMRFIQFRAHDIYSLSCSKRERLEQEKGSQIGYMFRSQFSNGSVFSASMIDSLLYQSFVKDYLPSVIRLLLGVDQTNSSGYLSTMIIDKKNCSIGTFGKLFLKFCYDTQDIPIGVYRTQICPNKNLEPRENIIINYDYVSHNQQVNAQIEQEEILNLLRNRMQNYNIPLSNNNLTNLENCHYNLSYVIINPQYDFNLKIGDIIYIIKKAENNF